MIQRHIHFIISVRLMNAQQSSRYGFSACADSSRCTAAAAIDGKTDSGASITSYGQGVEVWKSPRVNLRKRLG